MKVSLPKHAGPKECNSCKDAIVDSYFDGKVWIEGRYTWAYLCPKCWREKKGQLGTGRGQEYVLVEDKTWVKVAG